MVRERNGQEYSDEAENLRTARHVHSRGLIQRHFPARICWRDRLGSDAPIQCAAEVAARTVIWVSLLGIGINTATALMFMSGRKGDLNIRGAFLHMAADAAISAGVVVAGFAILWTGWHWIDPVVSLLISAVIVWGTWDLLRESVNLALQAVPQNIEPEKVERYLEELPGILKVHDLHIWAMSTTETALTAHLVKPDGRLDDPLLDQIQRELHDRFGIEHMTVQLECGNTDRSCAQESEHVV